VTRRIPGSTGSGFLEALEAFDRLDAEEFDLPSADYRRLREQVRDWQQEISRQTD
jgi:hypothetical protein